MATLQSLSFSGTLLQRGFWLYIWEVTAVDGRTVLYVGRTGDSSSANAQSPFNRLSQHLGTNKHANALRRQLMNVGIEPNDCLKFEMVAYGPIHAEGASMADHTPLRDRVAAMEKALCDALCTAGYTVLNSVNCRQKLDDESWQTALIKFTERFPKLRQTAE